MANIKFSQFTVGNTESDIDFVVGYKGANNIQISPANLLSATLAGYLPLTGGTMTGNINLNDSVNLGMGNSGDYAQFHDGTNTYLSNGTGDFYIRNQANDKDIIFQSDDGSGGNAEYFRVDGSSEINIFSKDTFFIDNVNLKVGSSGDLILVHDSSNSFIHNITGNLTIKNSANDSDIVFESDDGSGSVTEYFRLDGSLATGSRVYTVFPDNSTATFGNGFNFQIYNDGSNSYLQQGGTSGDLYIQQNVDDKDIIFQSDDGSGGIATYFFLDGGLVNGTSTLGAVNFPDKSKIFIGTGNDLRIYHNGTDSIFENVNGDLYIQNYADSKDIVFQSDDGSGGIATYFQVDGGNTNIKFSKDLYLLDNVKARIGTGSDLQIYHNASNSIVENFVGDLILKNSANDKDIIFQSDNGAGGVTTYFSIDGGAQLNRFAKNVMWNDSVVAYFGGGFDLQIFHDGTDSVIQNNTGDLEIQNRQNDGDIVFKSDDGTGGVTTYFFLDGSTASGGSLYTQFPDSSNLTFGAGNDLRIYHNGTNSNIENFNGTLQFVQNLNDGDIRFLCDDGSGGITEYFRLDGGIVRNVFSKNVGLEDNVQLIFGAGNDLQIYHDGGNSYIKDTGTGDLRIWADSPNISTASGNKIFYGNNGAAELYYTGGVKKLETTNTGIKISGVSEYADNTAAIAGGLTTGDVYRTGDLLKIVH